MNDPGLILPFQAPIVGAPVEALTGGVMVVVRCKCHRDNRPFIIPSTDVVSRCALCGNYYRIHKVEYTAGVHTAPSITVAHVVPTA